MSATVVVFIVLY